MVASVERTVINLCLDKLGVVVTERDISVAHRIKAGTKEKTRPILVRFSSRRKCDEVYHARRRLFVPRDTVVGEHKGVFISEHLTRGVANLFFEARQLVSVKKLGSAWTNKGLLNIKFTKDYGEKPTVIRSMAELTSKTRGLAVN